MKYKIESPNKTYMGIIGGVRFVDGFAEFETTNKNKHIIDWFKEKGYSVTEIKEDEPAPEATHNLDELKYEELKELATSKNITFAGNIKKEELIALLKGE